MDKINLYYIVRKGTNDRTLTRDRTVLISDSDAADCEIKQWAIDGENISIADFEEKFEDKDGEYRG